MKEIEMWRNVVEEGIMCAAVALAASARIARAGGFGALQRLLPGVAGGRRGGVA